MPSLLTSLCNNYMYVCYLGHYWELEQCTAYSCSWESNLNQLTESHTLYPKHVQQNYVVCVCARRQYQTQKPGTVVWSDEHCDIIRRIWHQLCIQKDVIVNLYAESLMFELTSKHVFICAKLLYWKFTFRIPKGFNNEQMLYTRKKIRSVCWGSL